MSKSKTRKTVDANKLFTARSDYSSVQQRSTLQETKRICQLFQSKKQKLLIPAQAPFTRDTMAHPQQIPYAIFTGVRSILPPSRPLFDLCEPRPYTCT